MFQKKKEELGADEAPNSIEPWEMLDEDGMARVTAKLRGAYPDQNLAPIARRIDNDLRACFDKGPDGTGKRMVVVHEAGGPTVKNYKGFGEWFDDAVAESRRS